MQNNGQIAERPAVVRQRININDQRYPDVAYYEGDTVDGVPNGIGRFCREGGILEYMGGVKDGVPNGEGTWFHDDGVTRHYEGKFENGKPNRKGILYHPNGKKKYEGDVKDGVPNGIGAFYHPDGVTKKYEGEFKDGERHGRGLARDHDNQIFYNGEWQTLPGAPGRPHGYGEYYNKLNDYDVSIKGRFDNGFFRNGMMHVQSIANPQINFALKVDFRNAQKVLQNFVQTISIEEGIINIAEHNMNVSSLPNLIVSHVMIFVESYGRITQEQLERVLAVQLERVFAAQLRQAEDMARVQPAQPALNLANIGNNQANVLQRRPVQNMEENVPQQYRPIEPAFEDRSVQQR